MVGPLHPDHAWERYAVIRRWPTWAAPIRSVDASGERIAPGVSGVVHGPPGVRVHFVIETVDEAARMWSWQVRLGALRMRLTHAVLPGAGLGSVATLATEGPAALVLIYPELARPALYQLVH